MNNNDFDTLIYKSNLALQYLKDKLNAYYYRNSSLDDQKTVEYIKYRLKTKDSIQKKVTNRLKLDLTLDNIKENIHDIAGVRIICPFLKDINTIIKYIENDPDIKVITVKDYITHPKESGYSSYHMIVQVPINIDGKKEYSYAEIQIRTLAMDTVASIEHKIVYKANSNLSPELRSNIKKIIKFINRIDHELDRLPRQKNKNLLYMNGEPLPNIFYQEEYIELQKKYYQALLKVEKIIDEIKQEYPVSGIYAPIEHTKARIKPDTSIISKLKEKNKEVLLPNIENKINDLGAMTVVCSFLSDAKEIIDKIRNQQDLIILGEKDYINNPKENGYSSHHFLVAVPLIIDDKKTYAKIEIQVRTTIMDFWNNIEHILCYKKEENEIIKNELQLIAHKLRTLESIMDDLAQTIKHQNTNFGTCKTLKKTKPKEESN